MKALWSSDHHTLHHETPTAHILGNLDRFFYKDNDLAKVDMTIFGGDFFEAMVDRPNPDMFRVEEWVTKFLRECTKHDTYAIWLEGTSSHDMKQPAHFQFNAPEGCKFMYIDTLCIKTFPEYDDLTIMFVPDNMGTMTPDEIWELALKVLGESGLEQVDLIAFHGAFEFQLVTQARHKAHNLERWSSIAKYAIFAGHIHKPVQKGKLYTSGSFDRDKHGEEHPKGAYQFELIKSKDYFNATFWENKNALPYLTMTVDPATTPEQLIKDIHAFIQPKRLPHHSHIRFMGGLSDIVNPMLPALQHDYPYFVFKAENLKQTNVLIDEELFDEKIYEGVTLLKDNLPSLLFKEVEPQLMKLEIPKGEALSVLVEFL